MISNFFHSARNGPATIGTRPGVAQRSRVGDPENGGRFTDMDSTRRAAAIQAIGTFAENHQVLFFTCHPDRAGALQSLAGAKSLQVTE